MKTTIFHVSEFQPDETAVDALARISALPKSRIKDAMNKGAVLLKRGGSQKRLRRSSTVLRNGDTLALHYNPELLALEPPQPQLLADEKRYSVWNKPAGLLAQGTHEGDHCSLLRMAEVQLAREVYLVHRLDREASGLMLIAHDGKAAAALSALFADHEGGVNKLYRVEVLGELPEQGEFESALDGKSALTRFLRLAFDAQTGRSIAGVELVTGRKHQIRRHFADAGFPVLGDPRYGEGNKDKRGLQLQAVRLTFTCPLKSKAREYRLD